MKIFALACLALCFCIAAVWIISIVVSQNQYVNLEVEVKRLGGTVIIDSDDPHRPVILVKLSSTKVTDAWLVNLKDLRQLILQR